MPLESLYQKQDAVGRCCLSLPEGLHTLGFTCVWGVHPQVKDDVYVRAELGKARCQALIVAFDSGVELKGGRSKLGPDRSRSDRERFPLETRDSMAHSASGP